MEFKPYPLYIPCDIHWFNEIPQSWKQVRVEQYLIKKDDEERINAEAEDLFKKCKIEEYNSKMKEKEAYKLYFDEAYKYTNFYEEGDE